MIELTREEVQGIINALNSNNGAKQNIAVTFLKRLLEGEKE